MDTGPTIMLWVPCPRTGKNRNTPDKRAFVDHLKPGAEAIAKVTEALAPRRRTD